MIAAFGPLMRLGLILAAGLLALVAACDDAESEPGGRTRVSASLEIFADMVRTVGGDRVDVEALLPSGADVHTYELPPNRVADIAQAGIVFINGLGLEESIEDVVKNNAKGPVIELAEGLPVLDSDEEHAEEGAAQGEGDEQGPGDANPHLWLDVRLAARYVERIRDELVSLDPGGAETYRANAAAYLEELNDLDREIEEALSAIPEANRRLVTFHDAYPYFAARYGLEVVVVVTSEGQEPSPQAVVELVEAIRDVPAVFKEPQFNTGVLERVAEDAGVRVLELLNDAYVGDVDSYLDLMRFNMEQLLEGLGGE